MNLLYTDNQNNYHTSREHLISGERASHNYNTLINYIYVPAEEIQLENYMNSVRNRFKYNTLHFSNEGLTFPPEHPFYSQKKLIEKTGLFNKIFKKMPKGGLLHIHATAGLSLDELIGLILDWNEEHAPSEKKNSEHIYIADTDNTHSVYPQGTLLYENQLNSDIRPYFISFLEFMKKPSAIDKLYDLLSFESDDIEKYPYIWDKFNLIFIRTAGLFCNSAFYYSYIKKLLLQCINDNISYIELRSGFENFTNPHLIHEILSCAGTHSTDYIYYAELLQDVDVNSPDTTFLNLIHHAMEEINDTYENKINVRVILNSNRALNPNIENERQKICQKIDAAITILNIYDNLSDYKDFVIGFDFVSEEDRNQTTDAYKSIIYSKSDSAYSRGLTRIQCINFFPHDGESNWFDNDNVFSAVHIARHRIGHGINLIKYPTLISKITENSDERLFIEPVLEICPISNQLLRYHKDIREHPLLTLKKMGIFCVIANDDPQILGNPGLSYDLWEAYIGMGLSLSDIKELIFISYFYKHYDYSADINTNVVYDDTTLVEAAKDFNADWDAFIKNVIPTIPTSV